MGKVINLDNYRKEKLFTCSICDKKTTRGFQFRWNEQFIICYECGDKNY